ncbi:hypothetical protein H6G94_21765 [Nostoc punctiforme FACHB-252]|uniref:Sacsin/Nov domain-containing protein n=1 Tax=Nostoc punctiforme FACHB-252 TaxID=1357509 RepID=A0ABR8HFB6_NOSPU|nr:hypothetical protein [Nostoc punctiforme]MBD2613870.1 hypothetical protein [Nostoc punctiforme FACHB-252]
MALHHPLGDIRNLRNSLLKSYKVGFPILKELVQNAEDAGATCLDYGWIKGIPQSTHPLLKSPAIFMLDNGEFTDENAECIRYLLGGSSKSSQQDSIGKFGLGLKSIFHLCEAFFYIGPDLENSQYPRADIFNPWAGANNKDKYHQNWDEFSPQDREHIKNTLKPLLTKTDYQHKWFIIWIPLRQKNHQAENCEFKYIKDAQDAFFEKIPDFLTNIDTKKQLSLLPILLNKIKYIRYWEQDLLNPKFNIIVDENSQRRQIFSQVKPGSQIKGRISLNPANIVNFLGSEIIATNPGFDRIKQSDGFPEEFRRIKPHCAVIFSRLNTVLPDEEPSLTLRTAVFLPIGDDEKFKINSSSQQSYYLTLHGYFFVDSGRTGILGWDKQKLTVNNSREAGDDNRSVLEKVWNFYLYQIILSMILDNLFKFIREYNLLEPEISSICQALSNSQLFTEKNNCEKICHNQQLVLCVTPQGNKWELLHKDIKILPLPAVPPCDLFPYLQSSPHTLTLLTASNLRFDNTKFNHWDAEKIGNVLSSLSPIDILLNHTAINYLVAFLKKCCLDFIKNQNEINTIQTHLIKFLQKGMSQLQWNTISAESKRALQVLIHIIKNSEVIYIGTPENIYRFLLKIELSILLLPKQLFPNPANNQNIEQSLPYQDAEKILSNLCQEIDNLETQRHETTFLQPVIKEFLKLSKNHLLDILSKNPTWQCLIASNRQNQVTFYSYNDFKTFKQKFILLIKHKNDYIIDLLIQALENIQPILVDNEIANLLKSDKNISPEYCNSDICKHILSKTPVLSSQPANRKQLLNELLKEVN